MEIFTSAETIVKVIFLFQSFVVITVYLCRTEYNEKISLKMSPLKVKLRLQGVLENMGKVCRLSNHL